MVCDLCAGSYVRDDNTAMNLIMKQFSGSLLCYWRNNEFQLDSFETKLNMATPGDWHNTSTPAAMQ